MRRRSRHIALILAGSLASSILVSPLPAERFYQRYWRIQLEQMEQPEIIEDDLTPIDKLPERRLRSGSDSMITDTVFESGGEAAETVDPELASSLGEYARAAYSLQTGDPTRALRAYEKALKGNPESTWVRLRLASLLILVNDLSRAESLLDDILDEQPDNIRALLFQGEIAFQRQRFPDAKNWFLRVIDVEPENIEALQSLATISYQADRDLAATKDYSQRILHIEDSNPTAMLLNAEASAFTGDAARAADLYARLVRFRPGLMQQMTDVARRLATAGRLDDALVIYERAVLINPDNDAVRLAWEQMLTRQGGDDAIDDAYRALLEGSSNDLRIHELYADFLERSDRVDELEALRLQMLTIDSDNQKSLLGLALIYTRRGDIAKAQPYYDRALAVNTTDPETYLLVAESYLTQGDMDRAMPLLERALALDPKNTFGLQTLASIEMDRGEFDKAEERLRKALEQSPADPGLLRQLGLLYSARGETRKAAELYQQVIAADPRDLNAWLSLARIYLEEGNETSLDILQKEAGDKMRRTSAFDVEFGLLAQEYGYFERSRAVLERAIYNAPEDLRARSILSTTYVKLDLPDLAVSVLTDADKYIKGNDELLAMRDSFLANLYMEIGRYANAEKAFEQLIDDEPDEIGFWAPYLTSLVKQGKDDKVTKGLNELMRQYRITNPVETDLIRAGVYMEQGDPARSLQILESVSAEHPGNPDVWFQMALAASEMNEIEKAEKYYREIIGKGFSEENPYYLTANNNLAYLLARNGIRLDEAEVLAQRALAIDPNAAYILDTAGWICFKKGEYERARQYLERAAALDRKDPEILTNLGQLYEVIGENGLARASYDKAIELDPSMDSSARELRDKLTSQPRTTE